MKSKVAIFWLYYDGLPIYALPYSSGASRRAVIDAAVKSHRTTPVCYPDAPFEFEKKLIDAEVRIYDHDRMGYQVI